MNVKVFPGVLLPLLLMAPPALPQDGAFLAGAGALYVLPVGSLHDRFNGSVGGMVFLGKQVSAQWTWIGKVEYVELSDLNAETLQKTVIVEEGGATTEYQVPLSKLSMQLKATGLSAEAILNLLRGSWFETSIHLGFGFTYWEHYRSGYNDSLYVQGPAPGGPVSVAYLSVPENRQSDWSGSVNLGCDLHFRMFDPVWLALGADYRLIIGELWQALDLDLENVSGMQSLCFRAGISVRF